MEICFINKNILVTGAGRGIGKDICKRLYKYKAKVIALSDNQKELDQVHEECNCDIEKICVDLGNWKSTREQLKNVRELHGLVNNAGIASVKPFLELTEKDYDDQFNINFKGAFNITQICMPQMQKGGSIVNIASLASLRACFGHSVYSATKAALDSLTRTLALEYGPENIRINSVNPAIILTQMGKQLWSDPVKADPFKARIPLKRFGEVPEVTDLVMFLLSDKSSFMTGHCAALDGGYCAW